MKGPYRPGDDPESDLFIQFINLELAELASTVAGFLSFPVPPTFYDLVDLDMSDADQVEKLREAAGRW